MEVQLRRHRWRDIFKDIVYLVRLVLLSTITQQLARASLSSERTYDRKIREILLAAQIEQRYTKSQILEEYLNTVYFGDGYYGVEAASRGYFGKAAADLQPHEAALLAALVRSPSTDAPSVGPSAR